MHAAGAQLAGMEQMDVAKRLLDNTARAGSLAGPHGRVDGRPGVVLFADSSSGGLDPAEQNQLQGWAVMDQQKHCLPKARSPIKEADAFVIFDEARCRCGVVLKMRT